MLAKYGFNQECVSLSAGFALCYCLLGKAPSAAVVMFVCVSVKEGEREGEKQLREEQTALM